jgi:hypothetical protein
MGSLGRTTLDKEIAREVILRDDVDTFELHRSYFSRNYPDSELIPLLYWAKAYQICAKSAVTWYRKELSNVDLPTLMFIVESTVRHSRDYIPLKLAHIADRLDPIRATLLTKGYIVDIPCRFLADIYYNLTIGQLRSTFRCPYNPELTVLFMFSIVPFSFGVGGHTYNVCNRENKYGNLLLYSGTSRDELFFNKDDTYSSPDDDWIAREHCDFGFTEEAIDQMYRDTMYKENQEFVFNLLERLKLLPSQKLRDSIASAYRVVNKLKNSEGQNTFVAPVVDKFGEV